jgi:tetratricopeptide (TPR) repeat protein
MIDATKQGNIARFFNHLPEDDKDIYPLTNIQTANLALYRSPTDGKIFLITMRDVEIGEQLGWDYAPGAEYWGNKADALRYFDKKDSRVLLTPLEAYSREGVSAFKANDFNKAILCFEKAKKLSPNDPALQWNLGRSYQRNNQVELALAIFQTIKNFDKADKLEIAIKECQAAPSLGTSASSSPSFVERLGGRSARSSAVTTDDEKQGKDSSKTHAELVKKTQSNSNTKS